MQLLAAIFSQSNAQCTKRVTQLDSFLLDSKNLALKHIDLKDVQKAYTMQCISKQVTIHQFKGKTKVRFIS